MQTKQSIPLRQAWALALEQQTRAVFTTYDLALTLWGLYRDRSVGGRQLRVVNTWPNRADFLRLRKELLNAAVLKPVAGLREGLAYTLLGRTDDSPDELACALDPFACVSHLSAMAHYGLTDRMPEQIYLTSPGDALWRSLAGERMLRDLGEELSTFVKAGLPALRRIKSDRISGRPVHRHTAATAGGFRAILGSSLRVANLGRTFLDMLREPRLCGGIVHVLSVYEEHARPNLRLILDELDRHGTAIDKVRAGYILEERCGLNDPRISAWVQLAARGGSRRLDAAVEYSPRFSERWALSINVPEALP